MQALWGYCRRKHRGSVFFALGLLQAVTSLVSILDNCPDLYISMRGSFPRKKAVN